MEKSNIDSKLSQKVRNNLESTFEDRRIKINDLVLAQLVNCLIYRNESIIQIIEQMNFSFEDKIYILKTVKDQQQLVRNWHEEVMGSMKTLFVQQIDQFFFKLKIEVSDNIKQNILDLSKNQTIQSQNQLKQIYKNIHIGQSEISQLNNLISEFRAKYFQENKDCLELTFLSFLNQFHKEQQDKEIFEAIKGDLINGFYNKNISEINGYFTAMKFSDETILKIQTNWAQLLDRYNINDEEIRTANLLKRFFHTLQVLNKDSNLIKSEKEYSNIFIDVSIVDKIGKDLSNFSQKQNINIKESELNNSMAKRVLKKPINLIDIIKDSKSYLFDIIKRRSRFDSYLSVLQYQLLNDFQSDALNEITQLEFIILFINSVNEQQQSQIGSWISQSNYPIPLFVRDKELRYKEMFKLQTQCYQNFHPVVVNFGTPSTKGTGKTKQILSILGENKNNLNFYMNDNKVGLIHDNSILAYYHLYKSIQLMDINYEVVSSIFELNQEFLRGVLTTICFSSIKIIHVSIKHDFDQTGSPKKELQQMLQDLCITPSINEKYQRFIFVYRDFSPSEKLLQNKVNESLKRILGTSLAGEISIPNLQKFQNNQYDSQISNISSEFLPILDRLLSEQEVKVSSYDFELFQQFYNNHSLLYFQKNQKETEFKRHYVLYNTENNLNIKRELTKINDFEKLFPFQFIDKEIKKKEKKLRFKEQQSNRFIYDFYDHKIEMQKTQLKKDIKALEKNKQTLTLSQPVQFILKILKQNLNNILVVENALIEWKIPIISPIRKQYGNLMQKLQQQKFNQIEGRSDDINKEIKKLDDQINNYDLSFETISKEVVSFLETFNQPDPQIRSLFKSITLQQLLHSKPVNLIDGKTLQFGNIILEQAIEKLDQTKKVYALSIIGAQSSAKSTLLNYLFGCGFETSEGRCTKGMYISIFNYSNFYILLLDTKGLLQVQALDRTFNNQVCTLAFALSNIVLFNNRGELTTVQKDLLEECIQALHIVCQAESKPKIIFCQRDQQSYDQATQQQILTNLLGNLNEAGKKVGIQVKDVIDINSEDLFLLAPAFISTTGMNENQVSYPNQLFSQQIMKLRHQIILNILSKDKGICYTNIKEFYDEGKQNWKLVLERGQSILELKSILEQKIKLELEKVAFEYVKKNYKELQKSLNNIYENNKKEKNFENIQEKFITILNGFIDRGKSEFYLEVQSQKYGDNKSWKDESMNEIISSYTYYKDQDEMYFKNMHQKFQSQTQLESLKEEISKQVNILIKNNQTKVPDFNKLFDQLTQNQLDQISKLLELSESEKSKKKILQKIYQNQKDLYHLNNANVEQKIFGVGLDDLFLFVMEQAEKIIEQISSQYEKINPDFKKILNDILKIEQQKIKLSSSDFENNQRILFSTLKQYVFEIENSLLKENDEQSKIIDMESIVNNYATKLQNKMETNYQKYQLFLKKIGQYLIFKLLQNTKREEIKQFEKQVKDLIKKEKQICEEVFNDVWCNSEKGKKAAKQASEKLIESFKTRQQAKIELVVKERINEQFPTTKSLNEQAYNMSFKDKNFPNVIKYINNITKFITELCDPIKHKNQDWIELQRRKLLNELKDVFQEVLNSSIYWNKSLNENQSKSFSQIFKSEKLLQYSTNLYIEIYDKIAIKKEFIEGFIKQFENEFASLPKVCEDIVTKLIQFSNKEVVQKSINAQGCEDRCPYCHNKCSEISGHPGDHKVIQHLPLGFSGQRNYHSQKVSLRRCIDKNMYEYEYQDFEKQQKEFISLEYHIEKYYPKWRESILPQGEGNNDTEETQNDVIIGWEGTKNYFIKKYNMIDDNREDWDYIFKQSGKKRLTEPFELYF